MFHSKASYSPMDKNNIKPHLNNINIREGVRSATIKDKKLRRKYFTSQIFNIIIILSIVIFQVKTIKTIQKLEEKNIDIERKLFAVETFINDTFGIFPEIWSDKFVPRHNALNNALSEYENPDYASVKGRPRRVVAPRKEDYGSFTMKEAVSNFHKIYHNIN
jgi:hypothetical protein